MTPTLTTYADPTAFLSEARAFLEQNESLNNMVLGLAIRIAEHPNWIDIPPYFAILRESGRPALGALMTPPSRLVLADDPKHPVDLSGQSIRVLIDNLQTSGWTVPGVFAEYALSEGFAMRWAEITGAACRVNTRERLYELHKVTPPQHPIAGFLRSADLKDSDTITDWRYAFSVEALHEANPDRFELKKQVEQRISVGDVFVWDDGRAVSMAVHNRPTPHGCSIGGVYTPPELRGRGYAYACVAALSQHLLDTGKQFCTLFTDLANPTSNAIYQKIGYRPVADFIEYIFEPA